MGITNSNKIISTDSIPCSGSLKVTLSLTAAPDITSNPTDIILVLDRSGSMSGSPLANMKLGAKTFIDIIDEATDSSQDGNIGSGSRIGIVSFAESATTDVALSTSVSTLKAAIDQLTAEGSTNHADAFTKATEMFDPMSGNGKVIVMFTDGNTTAGNPPAPVAAAARAAGITIYCIGLTGSDGIDVSALNDWATDPDTSHVSVTPNDSELEDLFAELAANISKPGATNIQIHEILNPDFQITSVLSPTKGTVSMPSSNTLVWSINELGVSANEGAALEFTIKHISTSSGKKAVNQSITYTDTENNIVSFPSPEVTVDCGVNICAEECPVPVNIRIDGCQDIVEYDLGDVSLESLGRILELSLTIKNVCPNRRVALAVILTETDQSCTEHSRGMKVFTIPAHQFPGCRDITVKCIRFVLPEDITESGNPHSLCNQRCFKARVISNYIDTASCKTCSCD